MTMHEPRKRPRAELSAEQKVAFAILLFLGLGGVILGFLSFGANLRRPFEIQHIESLAKGQYLTFEQQEEAEVQQLKARDTDADGITDYDEIYIFKTSPYLADTDSDGYDDQVEIFSDEDPNCPRGTNCGGVLSEDTAADTSVDPNQFLDSGAPSVPSVFGNTTGVTLDSREDIESFLKSLTIDQIRQALLDQGLSQEQVDSITDDQIRAYFDQAVEEATATGELESLLGLPADTTAPVPVAETESTLQTSPDNSQLDPNVYQPAQY